MKILLEDFYLQAVFKVRRFLFSAFLLTLEIVETLRTKIFFWYIEIYNKNYFKEKLYSCSATYKKFSVGNLKARLWRNKTHWEFLTYFFKKFQWSRKDKMTCFNKLLPVCYFYHRIIKFLFQNKKQWSNKFCIVLYTLKNKSNERVRSNPKFEKVVSSRLSARPDLNQFFFSLPHSSSDFKAGSFAFSSTCSSPLHLLLLSWS